MIAPKVNNPVYQAQLNTQGYAVIPAFLNPAQITPLHNFFYDTLPQSQVDVPFFTTHWSSQKEYRQQINGYVQQLLLPSLEQHFSAYKCIFGYYLFKKPDAATSVYMHQDWSLTDESQYASYILWIPLVDTNQHNGCFKVVPGSHHKFNAPRGTNIQQLHPGISEKDFTAVPIQAGDAIVFDTRLLHASPPNLSAVDRLATGLVLLPEQAPVNHYYFNKDTNETTRYLANDTFLVDAYYDYKQRLPANYILSFVHPQNQTV